MNRSFMFASLVGLSALGMTAAPASAFVFGVDYGLSGQDVHPGLIEGAGPNAAGAVPHIVSSGPYSVSLSATSTNGAQFQFRAPGQAERYDVTGTSVDDLVEDLIIARDAVTSAAVDNMRLTITGLAAGDYTFRSYHNENIFAGTNPGFAYGQMITASIGGHARGSVIGLDLNSRNNIPTPESDLRYIEFQITSNGSDPIVIDYLASGKADQNYMFTNGFIVSNVPEPASIALLGVGGLLALRRRR